MRRIRIGVSGCLMGDRVRYDGGHRYDPFITAVLGRCFELVPVCPEVEAGLGIPRPPIELVRTGAGLRALGAADRRLDPTDRLATLPSTLSGRQQPLHGIDGYILKSRSPSCGLRVPVHGEDGAIQGEAAGIFAAALERQCPLLPLVDEQQVSAPGLCERFVQRVWLHRDWRELRIQADPVAGLADFHRRWTRECATADPALEALLRQVARDRTGATADRYIRRLVSGFPLLH